MQQAEVHKGADAIRIVHTVMVNFIGLPLLRDNYPSLKVWGDGIEVESYVPCCWPETPPETGAPEMGMGGGGLWVTLTSGSSFCFSFSTCNSATSLVVKCVCTMCTQ